MIIVTGGAGFIGSAFVWKLNQQGIEDILVVDNLDRTSKWKNLVNLRYTEYLHKNVFLERVLRDDLDRPVDAVIHMGACSSTTEPDADYLMENNYRYSKVLAEYCLAKSARFIYASSAATYGDGSLGFLDDEEQLEALRPLNMYAYSKQLFDLWARRNSVLDQMVGLKFFNVFGPNEYHKEEMKSVACKAFHQISETGRLKLFKSYREDFPHGGQMRDFVYIKDCVDVMWWFLDTPEKNGIYNVGTGTARTWNDLAGAVFSAMGREPEIEYIPMPEIIRDKYQYFTEAGMQKLHQAGCPVRFTPLEEAVSDYLNGYLAAADSYLG
ncbi:MAG: ADP-glyceromanno-heptose 6-epimerase [Desulfovibrionales bacterium]